MKPIITRYLLIVFCVVQVPLVIAQHVEKKATGTGKAYPAAFTITTREFDNLFLYKPNEAVSCSTNKYLDKASLLLNSKSGDMQFLKLKLNYFKNAFLSVQVNGTASTQVFIISDDRSVFYRGKFEKNKILMSKCSEDDILSE